MGLLDPSRCRGKMSRVSHLLRRCRDHIENLPIQIVNCIPDVEVTLSCLDAKVGVVDCIHIADVDSLFDVVVRIAYPDVDAKCVDCTRMVVVDCVFDVVVALIFDVSHVDDADDICKIMDDYVVHGFDAVNADHAVFDVCVCMWETVLK